MKTIEHDIVKIPTYALPLIVNGDNTGIAEDDMENILSFLNGLQDHADEINCMFDLFPIDDTEYFSSTPAFGLPCMVEDYKLLYMRPE